MTSGTVKFFNGEKGFGFIKPDDGGSDVFVHISQLKRAGLDGLRQGQRLDFSIGEFKGKKQAEIISQRDEPDVDTSSGGQDRDNRVRNSNHYFREVKDHYSRADRGGFSSKNDFEKSYDRMWRSIRDAK